MFLSMKKDILSLLTSGYLGITYLRRTKPFRYVALPNIWHLRSSKNKGMENLQSMKIRSFKDNGEMESVKVME